MAIISSKEGGLFTEINITPLTDIFLVLLIIMMVMAPMFQNVDKNISVPEINSGINVEDGNTTISVTKQGDFYVDGKSSSASDLEAALTKIVNEKSGKKVVVRADKDTKSKEIMKIIQAAQYAGFEKLVVAGEPLSKKQQQELYDKSQPEETDVP